MKSKTKIYLSHTQRRFFFLLTVILIAWQTSFIVHQYISKYNKDLAAAKLYGDSVASEIVLTLDHSMHTSEMLKDLYLEFGDNFLHKFSDIAARLYEDNPVIGSLYMAPNAVIQTAYPPSVAESTLGFEMLKDPEQGMASQLAIDTKEITVSGPYRLVEGGVGFIIRNPIFDEDGNFLAFSIVIVDWEKFVNEVLWYTNNADSNYNFAVWKKGETTAVTNEFGFIFSNCKKDVSKAIDIGVTVPNDLWHLSVEPSNGWNRFKNIIPDVLITCFIVFAILSSVYLRMRSNARHIYRSQHDDLTGLLARTTFLKNFEKLLTSNQNKKYSVVAADIENFKVVNSMYGTKMGDEILQYLGRCFVEYAPSSLCSRFGSDHFIFVIPFVNEEEDVGFLEEAAELIVKNAPVEGLTIKYGFYGDVDKTVPANLICDRAILAAKSILHRYDKVIANYDGPLSSKNLTAQILESSFLSALKSNDFKIWYQPKYDAKSEQLVGAEALVRWIRSDGTIISPADFIHVFEEDGLIYKLDLYVFENVCKQMKKLMDDGYKIVPVSVNVSRASLQHSNIIKEYERILKQVGLSADYVPLEITESASSINKQIKQFTEDLKVSGFKIHMDDFGTGLSSLESLNFLPFDVIKFDKSLIDYIGTPVGEELIRHSMELIQFMKLKVIAEGVETKEQLEFLRKLNCDYIQGYYFSAPIPYEKYVNVLNNI